MTKDILSAVKMVRISFCETSVYTFNTSNVGIGFTEQKSVFFLKCLTF